MGFSARVRGAPCAAGIRCDQARLPAEMAVCGDPELLRLDAQLATLFAGTSRLPGPNRADLAATQKQWQRNMAACAADKSGLVGRYTSRISALRQATAQQLKTMGKWA